MKQYMKYIMTMALLLTTIGTWAEQKVEVKYVIEGSGTVEAAITGGSICTLTVTPASGYYITVDHLTAVKITSGNNAQAPTKAPGVDQSTITITATDATADPHSTTTYTFTMPEDENIDVEVTADFQELIAITPTVTLQGWTYGAEPNEPVVGNNPGNGAVEFSYAVKGTTTYTRDVPENVGDYTIRASVAAARQYAAGEATADFSISKAVATVTKAPVANTLTYTGAPQALVATGETTSGTLMYSLSNVEGFSENIPTGTDAGKYTVYYFVQADANHINSDTLSVDVTIAAKTLTEEMIADIADQIYTGHAVEPEVTVKHGDKVLVLDTDYTIAYTNNIKVGTASVSITGKGNYTGTVTKEYSIVAIEYGLKVDGIVVTNANSSDVLGNGSESVTFDGEHQLVLNNYKGKENVFNTIEVSMDSLAIYLIGKNEVDYLTSRNGKHKLTFTTDGNDAGSLKITGDIDGFDDVKYEQNLGLYDNEVRVGVDPLVNESGEEKTVDVGNATLPDDQVVNTVIDNVIVTADKSNGDGVKNNAVELGSGMTTEEVSNVIRNHAPGTDEYAKKFSGITFMIPAGTGFIEIVVKTGKGGVLAIQIGDQAPIYITDLDDFEAVKIPYATQIATYVRGFNAINLEHFAPGKAGKKTSTTIGIRTVGVKAKVAQASNPPAKNNVPQEEQVSTDEVNGLVQADANGNLSIDDTNAFGVVTLPENMMAGEPYSPCVDFRNTNVTGLFVSRTTGVFNGVSENTFIFMPAGNNTDEANIVIGAVCYHAKMDGNMKDGEQFAPADGFTTQSAELTTSFAQGQLATVYLPFAITAAEAAQWGTFYTFNGIERGYVKIKETTEDLQPNVPYLFKAFEDGTKITTGVVDVVLPQGNGAQHRTDGDKLVGCYNHQTAADGMYLLRNEGTDFKFEKMQAGDKIKPFQAYLKVESDNSTILQVTDNDEVPTGIVSVKNETNNVIWQTLSGMTLDKKPKDKGIYIRNGKKIVVR